MGKRKVDAEADEVLLGHTPVPGQRRNLSHQAEALAAAEASRTIKFRNGQSELMLSFVSQAETDVGREIRRINFRHCTI